MKKEKIYDEVLKTFIKYIPSAYPQRELGSVVIIPKNVIKEFSADTLNFFKFRTLSVEFSAYSDPCNKTTVLTFSSFDFKKKWFYPTPVYFLLNGRNYVLVF